MGKAQSKRSVDITTETKKGTEDEITEKMEKIEDLDKKDVVNGDATMSEKSDEKKDTTNEVENDKDMTTVKDVDVLASGDAAETQNVAETPKDEGGSVTAEEISPLADESIKKSKKEKVKKKWSFRSISFGKKDKQKPAKSEDAAEDGSAATNGADTDEKTINESEDTQKDKSSNENEDKTKENHENGNSTPPELNGDGDQNEDKKPSDEKSNDITANTTNNTTTTETCAPVQNETAADSSELSEKTESTAVKNETKISENATVDDSSKNGNGLDDKMNATNQEPQKADVTNISVETPSDKTSTLMTNETSVTTNGEVDQIHQNGGHGESEQEFIEKSKAQIEVNSNTDNKVSAATLDSISSTSINPSNVQIHAQDLNASSEKPDEIIQIITEESVIQKSTVTETNNCSVDQSSLCEIVSMVDVENKVQVEPTSDLMSEAIDNAKSSEDKLGVDPSPPPLPISPPPSQVSVFAFTSNDESIDDSIKIKNFEPTTKINNLHEEEKNNELLPALSELPIIKTIDRQDTETTKLNEKKVDENSTTCLIERVLEICANDGFVENVDVQCRQDNKKEIKEDETSICKDNEVPLDVLIEEKPQIKSQEDSVAVAAAVIDEITETAVQIVNQHLNSNEERIVGDNEGQKEGTVVAESNGNKTQNNEQEDHAGDQEHIREIANCSSEGVSVIEQTNNLTFECSLDFKTSESIQQKLGEMNSLKKSEDILEEKYLDPTKEFATAKDIKDVTVAEITQDLSVTCE